jgi:DNA repair ATPase RecN
MTAATVKGTEMNPANALDNLLTAVHAALPEAEEFDAFVANRAAAQAELSALRSELTAAKHDLDYAKFELNDARQALQRVKDETAWGIKDLGKVRQELDELARIARKRT